MMGDFDIYLWKILSLASQLKLLYEKIIIPLILLVVGITSNAQSAKKELPPPPPQPMNEVVKSEPQKIKASEPLDDDFYKRNPSVSNFSRQGQHHYS